MVHFGPAHPQGCRTVLLEEAPNNAARQRLSDCDWKVGVRIGEAAVPGPWAGLDHQDCRFDEALVGHQTGEDSWQQLEDLREHYGDGGAARSSEGEPTLPEAGKDSFEQAPLEPWDRNDGAAPPGLLSDDGAEPWDFDMAVEQQSGLDDDADDAWPVGPEDVTQPAYASHVSDCRAPAVASNGTTIPAFAAASKFHGSRCGMVFKSGPLGLGYYADLGTLPPMVPERHEEAALAYLRDCRGDKLECGRALLSLDCLVPEQPWQHCPGQWRRSRKRNRPNRRRGKRKHRAALDCSEADGLLQADASFRDAGLWAIDSLNGSAASTANSYLDGCAADACLIQETRTVGLSTSAAERAAAGAKWQFAINEADVTPAGSTSAGVGVAVRSHIGLGEDAAVQPPGEWRSRVAVRWMGGYAKGGIHLISVYLWHSEGLSVRNLQLLEVVANIIRVIVGPWILGGDFNITPEVLRASGWLALVGAEVRGTAQATCKGKEYDYFVLPSSLLGEVVAVLPVVDSGISPHTPVRILLKGAPRSHRVRQLAAPPKCPAMLPQSCLRDDVGGLWDHIGKDSPDDDLTARVNKLDGDFKRWFTLVEQQLADIQMIEGRSRERFICRGVGPRFVWRPAVGAPGSQQPRLSAITRAWSATASWLTDVLLTFSSDRLLVQQRGRKMARRLINHKWENLGQSVHAMAFQQWYSTITVEVLSCRTSLCWFRATARLIADQAQRYDLAKSRAAFLSWLYDGPAKTIRRLHQLTRVACGWIPTPIGQPDQGKNRGEEEQWDAEEEYYDCDEHASLAEDGEWPLRHACAPLGGQQEVDAEAERWFGEWLVGRDMPRLSWPMELQDDQAKLPALQIHTMRRAALTFPAGTGLGWDKCHPRAIARCSDEALEALIRLLLLCELVGEWPESIGCTIIVLIPKADGGRRPIGLLPSIVRWWMRVRLEVARRWQTLHDRPYFFAGPSRSATKAAWLQAARAELVSLARCIKYLAFLLDLIKAFERVPHEWLVEQAKKYEYSLSVLRLSIAAYRLPRTVSIAAVCSRLVVATRGITAGAVHATIELRLLLIQPLDAAMLASPHVSISAYVDDVTIEAVGTDRLVHKAVVGATKSFTCDLVNMGMEFSDTKNVCSSSDSGLARKAVQALPELKVKLCQRTKSLGSGLGAGVARNASVASRRLQSFRSRLGRFRRQRMEGRRNVELVLKTGATAGLTFGAEAMGVSSTMLLSQRRAVAATLVGSGAGDLDLRLILAELESRGKFDPAFPAHCGPIVTWATAVWESWLPLPTLRALYQQGCKLRSLSSSPWPRVKGPGAALFATAARLGWEVTSPTSLRTHDGYELHLLRDSPAFVKVSVEEAVGSWRWRQVAARLPSIVSDLALKVAGVPPEQRQEARRRCELQPGCGAFVQPIAKLLRSGTGTGTNWTPQHSGALLSAMTDRQWPQARHYKVGHDVEGPNCLLCVHAGRCTQETRDPRFVGTLTHRLYCCPSLQPLRDKHMPVWLRRVVHSHLRSDQSLPSELIPFLTRGLVCHPSAWLPQPAEMDSFHWQVQPADGFVAGKVYVDGSQRDAEPRFFGCCSRRGWAFTAVDGGVVVASAYGLPPAWIRSIPGAETWALLQAMQVSMPGNPFRTDCQAVQTNCQKSLRELTSSSQRLARALAPIALFLEDASADAVVWMPAHTAQHQVGVARLSNGEPLTEEDRSCNAEADRLAKLAVEEDRLPAGTRKLLLAHASKVVDVAAWIGTATLAANQLEAWESHDGTVIKVTLRDAHAASRSKKPPRTKPPKARVPQPKTAAERLVEEPRIAALRSRVLARASSQPLHAPATASAVTVSAAVVPEVRASPSGSLGAATRGRRRAWVRPSSALAPLGLVTARPPAPAGSFQSEQCTGQACDGLQKSKTHSSGDEPSAVQDLLELERSGLRVAWPCSPRARAGTLAAPCQVRLPDSDAAQDGGSGGCGLPSISEQEDAELQQELRELQKCGLRVAWPR